MQIHDEKLSDITRYIDKQRLLPLEEWDPFFRNYFRYVEKFINIGPETRILEIGPGPGWFPIMCKLKGLNCKGLEISPQLVEFAMELGRKHGVEPDIELGNLEDSDIGTAQYDLIIASSVFEHVEHWRKGIQKIFAALRPGGVLYFISTNKFSVFKSGEYDFPLYGWLPDQWRYKMRIAKQGPDIMKLGIDFNQFRYPLLRREFGKAGFSQIHDKVDLYSPDGGSAGWKKTVGQLCKSVPPLRHTALTFTDATMFVCIK
jgi:SAM-dependent methyltransferase